MCYFIMRTSTKNGGSREILHITFIVTKDCQLACKYCYLIGKNTNERMEWSVAKKMLDFLFYNHEYFNEDSIVLDFIGGEPLIEVDLIDRICDYFKKQAFSLEHKWFNSYRINVSTNGLNYNSKKVQSFIKKNHRHLSIGITIDGDKYKHNLNRIYKSDGHGSYDSVARNIPLWLKQFPQAGTKVTISSEDLPYVKNSIIHLFKLGIHEVNVNCVFENVWKEGDDMVFESQLIMLADEIIDNRWYTDYFCSFFSERIGHPLAFADNSNWCGCGRMIAVDAHGFLYPCTRFAKFSLREKKPRIIGTLENGIKKNLIRPFRTLDRISQSRPECIDCEVASGCAWCQGENYDAADSPTVYQRATAICKMHKARVRANNYYWNKLYRKLELEGIAKEEAKQHVKSSTPNYC